MAYEEALVLFRNLTPDHQRDVLDFMELLRFRERSPEYVVRWNENSGKPSKNVKTVDRV